MYLPLQRAAGAESAAGEYIPNGLMRATESILNMQVAVDGIRDRYPRRHIMCMSREDGIAVNLGGTANYFLIFVPSAG